MSIRAQFDDEEWFLLGSAPAMIAAAMSGASPGGAIREMVAGMRGTVEGARAHPDSELVTTLLEKAANWDEAKEKAKDYRERAKARLEAAGITSREALLDQAVADCEAVAALVDTRCEPAEAGAYKAWCVSIARRVAEAAKEGGFLGFGGERISEGERAMMARIENALGVETGVLLA